MDYHAVANGSILKHQKFFNLYLNCDEKIMEINKKRPVLSHIKDLFGGRGRDGLVVSVIAFLV